MTHQLVINDHFLLPPLNIHIHKVYSSLAHSIVIQCLFHHFFIQPQQLHNTHKPTYFHFTHFHTFTLYISK